MIFCKCHLATGLEAYSRLHIKQKWCLGRDVFHQRQAIVPCLWRFWRAEGWTHYWSEKLPLSKCRHTLRTSQNQLDFNSFGFPLKSQHLCLVWVQLLRVTETRLRLYPLVSSFLLCHSFPHPPSLIALAVIKMPSSITPNGRGGRDVCLISMSWNKWRW